MAIFGFGRRSTPNADKYIVPPVSWADPENAAFFARIGAKPNDPNNLRVTHDDVAKTIDEGRKTVDERIRQIKAKALAEGHDDIHLGMFWLIQENCWNGEVGEFLIYHLGLNPYDEWNTVITGDRRTASILDIPIYPGGVIPHLARTGETVLLQLRDKLRAAREEALRTHEFGRAAQGSRKSVGDGIMTLKRYMGWHFSFVAQHGFGRPVRRRSEPRGKLSLRNTALVPNK